VLNQSEDEVDKYNNQDEAWKPTLREAQSYDRCSSGGYSFRHDEMEIDRKLGQVDNYCDAVLAEMVTPHEGQRPV
jgi:hypothetical protein